MLSVLDLLPELLKGAAVTIELTILAACVGLLFGVTSAFGRLSRHRLIRTIASVYVEVFRGSSAIVQIFFFFFVLPSSDSRCRRSPRACSRWGSTWAPTPLKSCALRSECGPRPAGCRHCAEHDAAGRRCVSIIFPQALVAMLPPFGNLLIELLKGTALVSLITLSELTFSGKVLLHSVGRRTRSTSSS